MPATRHSPRRARRRLIVLLALLAALLACATSESRRRWELALLQADGLVDDERWDEARAAYAALYDDAPNESYRRYIVFRYGLIEERQDHFEAAAGYYLQLMENHELYDFDDEYTPRAIYRIGRIDYDELGRQDEALEIWKTLVHSYPDDSLGPTQRALTGILVHYEDRELHEEAVRYLAGEFPALRETSMGDNMLYWLGYWYRVHLGDPEQAYQLFSRLRRDYYDTSGLRPEAEWQMVEILHEAGEYEREVELLQEMNDEHEGSLILGSWASTSMEDAGYRIGVVILEDIHQPQRAIEALEAFIDEWSYSLLTDDAYYHIVLASLELGDDAETERRARYFVEHYDESRYLDEVEAILAELSRGGGGAP